jgi:hypothetical protein
VTSNGAIRREQHPGSLERLDLLQRLVAIHTEDGEWETFVWLLRRGGYDVTSEGVRYVGN